MIQNTVVRFNIGTGGKYVTGIIQSVTDAKPYVVMFQKSLGVDKEKGMPIMKNVQINCLIELVVKLGTQGIYAKPRKVSVAHVSNGMLTE